MAGGLRGRWEWDDTRRERGEEPNAVAEELSNGSRGGDHESVS